MKNKNRPAMLLPFQMLTSVDHHKAAAEHLEEAAAHHRLAAVYYTLGDYDQAEENARIARYFSCKAQEHSLMATE